MTPPPRSLWLQVARRSVLGMASAPTFATTPEPSPAHRRGQWQPGVGVVITCGGHGGCVCAPSSPGRRRGDGHQNVRVVCAKRVLQLRHLGGVRQHTTGGHARRATGHRCSAGTWQDGPNVERGALTCSGAQGCEHAGHARVTRKERRGKVVVVCDTGLVLRQRARFEHWTTQRDVGGCGGGCGRHHVDWPVVLVSPLPCANVAVWDTPNTRNPGEVAPEHEHGTRLRVRSLERVWPGRHINHPSSQPPTANTRRTCSCGRRRGMQPFWPGATPPMQSAA